MFSSDDKTFAYYIMFVFFVVVFIIGCMYVIDKKACLSKYRDFNPEYVGLITGCMVEYNGKTVPSESLRVME